MSLFYGKKGEIVTTVLILSALITIVGTLIGAGSKFILNSSAYSFAPRVERTIDKTTLTVTVTGTKQVQITGNVCFGSGFGSGIERASIWATDDPPGKHIISNLSGLTFSSGAGYPAPCIKPDFEGDAILTNAGATPNRAFGLTATFGSDLTDKCVDVYLHYSSNRQGKWPNFRRFKVNKDGLCNLSASPTPPTSQAPTLPISPSSSPSRFPSLGPTIIFPTRFPTTRPSSTPPVKPSSSPSVTPPICVFPANPGWLDGNKSKFRNSSWLTGHKYGDCPSTNTLGFWPNSDIDCLIGDSGGGPTAADKANVAEPAGLFYKHLTPTDALSLMPITRQSTDNLQGDQETEDVKSFIRDIVLREIKKDPKKFASLSFGSISAGLEGGVDGQTLRSVSFWVHPVIEKVLTDAITIRERARLVYQPYIEGAIGRPVSTDDAEQLYTQALNHCGSSAQGGIQSGLGFKKEFGDYTVVVQNWADGAADDLFSDFRDCTIHIVRKAICVPTPTAVQKAHITGTVAVHSCLQVEKMSVMRCEKGGGRGTCDEIPQTQGPADNAIWFDRVNSDFNKNVFVYQYRMVNDSLGNDVVPGEKYRLRAALMRTGTRTYASPWNETPVVASGVQNFSIDVPNSECGPTGQPQPTVVAPTNPAPRCIFNPISFVKIRENGEERLFSEISGDSAWSILNDKRKARFGEDIKLRSLFGQDGQYQPCGPQGCDLGAVKYCCVDTVNSPEYAYEVHKAPNNYDLAKVQLYFPKDKFRILEKCNSNGVCTSNFTNDSPADRVDNLPVGCNQVYHYGWVVERIPAGSCNLTNTCAPKIKDIASGDISASSVKIHWNPPANGCTYTN